MNTSCKGTNAPGNDTDRARPRRRPGLRWQNKMEVDLNEVFARVKIHKRGKVKKQFSDIRPNYRDEEISRANNTR